MKAFHAVAVAAVLLLSSACFAQDPVTIAPTRTFSFSASAVALPSGKTTVAATVLGGTFAVTDKLSLRQTNILAQAGDMTGYYGGFEYVLPSLSKKLNAVSVFDASHIQFYVTGSAGVDRVSSHGSDTYQHYSFLAGGGARYDPTGSGKFTVQLAEIQYLKAPGYANNTAIVASGFKFGF
jgi:hypothetical protein